MKMNPKICSRSNETQARYPSQGLTSVLEKLHGRFSKWELRINSNSGETAWGKLTISPFPFGFGVPCGYLLVFCFCLTSGLAVLATGGVLTAVLAAAAACVSALASRPALCKTEQLPFHLSLYSCVRDCNHHSDGGKGGANLADCLFRGSLEGLRYTQDALMMGGAKTYGRGDPLEGPLF